METKWILKLIDQVTAPLESIFGHANGAAEAVSAIGDQAGDVEQAIRRVSRPMQQAAGAAGHLGDSIGETSDEATRLRRNIETVQQNLDHYRGRLQVETDPERIRTYQTMIEELEERLHNLEHLPDPGQSSNNWASIATAANQTYEIVEKVIDSLDWAPEIATLQKNIERFTGATGDQLDSLTRKTYRIAEVFGEDADEIATAANALTKQVGGTFEQNLNLIQAGFEKGANLNKDMLDQLKEYGPQLKAAGISGAEGLAIMAKAGKEGVFSDKALDALKEANLALREMGQPQIQALQAVGLKVKDVVGKTTFEAVQTITKAMAKAPIQARQMVLTDIFKGAGEDAGLAFVQGLSSVDMDITKIPSVEQAGASTKGFLADMKSWFATSFSGMAETVTVAGSIGAALAGFLPVFTAIRTSTLGVTIATNIATAAQWAWNAAITANPIGLIIAGIAALVGGIILAWKKFEGFREVVMGLWEVFKTVFNNIAGLFKVVFAPIGEAISAIMEGRYTDAAKAVLKLNPISMGVAAGQYIAGGGLTKGVGDAYTKGKAEGKASYEADHKDDKKEKTDSGFTNIFDNGKPGKGNTLDGKIFNPQTGQMGNGLNIQGAGAGGGKSLTMTLNITNHFSNISNKLDVRRVADEVAGLINDRLRDAAVSIS